MSSKLAEIYSEIELEYLDRTSVSRELNDQAKGVMPGGDTRSTVHFAPHPAYMVRGGGCRMWDADGHEYIDALSNYTSLIHGHAHPALTAAAAAEMERGTIYGAPSRIQISHAAHLCRRVPGLERVRYCNSGTEATMFALRAARAFTGRELIIKMDGGYHGTHDQAEVNLKPDVETDGPPRTIAPRGVPGCTESGVLIAPFNDVPAMAALLAEHGPDVAAVIVEPMMGAGGLIEAAPGYLAALRELTREHGSLLIFDEVITFRLHHGGLQSEVGVNPDLTCLAKIIGGGMPIGAFGGRAEVMAVFDPHVEKPVGHGGTFNGNSISLAAGLAGLDLYDQPAVERLNGLGNRLKAGFRTALRHNGIAAVITGRGSLLNVHFGPSRPANARQAALGSARHAPLLRALHLAMVNRGVHSAPRGMYITSTPMKETDIDRISADFGQTLERLKPGIAQGWPELITD